MQDPIADSRTRIRNGRSFCRLWCPCLPQSKKLAIANLLLKEGYIASVTVNAHT